MKVGTLCYATDSGLGILAKSFYDNGVVTHPVVVRHGRHPTHNEWYPGAPVLGNLNSDGHWSEVEEYLGGLDAVLFFETPFRWELIEYLRRLKVKTFLMTMYECTPQKLPAVPDVFLCPSCLDMDIFEDPMWRYSREAFKVRDGILGAKAVWTPVPVSVPWRQRTRAEVFVHNAGHGGLKGRNGTNELIQCLLYIKSPAKMIIRSQIDYEIKLFKSRVSKVGNIELDYRVGTVPADQLYTEGDVFVFPEKFNGLSLPLQEAYASGMLVMATDRFPNNTYLPPEPLIPTSGTRRNRIGPPYTEFDEAVLDPKQIADTIDFWYGKDITSYSEEGRAWAEANSWEKLKPRYLEILES